MKLELLRVARLGFDVETVLKDEAFTKRGKLRKRFEMPVAALLRMEAYRFIDSATPADFLKNMKITREEVEVEDEPPKEAKP